MKYSNDYYRVVYALTQIYNDAYSGYIAVHHEYLATTELDIL